MPTDLEQPAPDVPETFSEYSAEFFRPPVRMSLSNRKCNVSLNEDVYVMIRRTLNYLGDGESTVGGYVENILLSHLTQYRDILNTETSKRLKQPLIPDSVSS
ncbi:DUF3408 domain-containing protein [Porphyromonas sp.]|uniref:DUF3408 domain-containing protein n=1 Tax=Porphyromonas sp. TaxID=1924944 RepID=UPI003AB74333